MSRYRRSAAARPPGNPAARLWSQRTGSLSVELALVVMVLIVITLGAVDVGRLMVERLRVASAARAGAQYAIQDDGAMDDAAGIADAARQDAGAAGAALSVASRSYCACPGSTASSCSNSCVDGNYPPQFVEVTASRSLDLLFAYPGIDPSPTVAGVSTLRVR